MRRKGPVNFADLLAVLPIDPLAIAGVLSVVFFSAVLRGFAGFGFAVAAVPLLSLHFQPLLAVTSVVVLQFMIGLLDGPAARRDCDWSSVKWLALGALVGSPIGLALLSVAPVALARVGIGAISLIAALSFGSRTSAPRLPPVLFGLGAGFLAGLFNGLAAMPGPPVVAYYIAQQTKRATMRASLFVFFTSTSAMALVIALWMGLIKGPAVMLALLGLPVTLVGNALGARLAAFGSDRLHKLVCVVLLTIIAIASIAKGVLELGSF